MKRITDERIRTEQQKLHASAFGIALLGLWLLISIRLFFLKQDPMEYIDIFILTMLLSVYVLSGTIKKGNYSNNVSNNISKTVILISSSVGTVVYSLVQVFLFKVEFNTSSDVLRFLISILGFWFIWGILQYCFMLLSKRQSNKDTE